MEEAKLKLEEAQKRFEAAEEELMAAKQRYRKAKEELEAAEKDMAACAGQSPQEIKKTPVLKVPVLNIKHQYMNNSKVAGMLTTLGIKIEEDTAEIDTTIRDGIVTRADIWMDDDLTATSVNLTPFDAVVMDAVYTILCSGYRIFTADSIAKVIAGNMNFRLNARFSALPVIPVESEYQVNGKPAQAYRITETSILYVYASLLHQIVDVPSEWMNTSKLFSDTAEAVLIKRYVIKRVAQIINPKNKIKSNKIAFHWNDHGQLKGMFPDLGYEITGDSRWRSIKKRVRRIVELTLQSLQEQEVITGYKEYRDDGTNNPASPVMGYEVFYTAPARIKKKSHAT